MKPQIRAFKALIKFETYILSIRHRLRHYANRCYCSGRITGLDWPEFTMNFNYCCQVIKKMGYIPVNPLSLPKRKAWAGYMVQDLFELLLCRSVYFQDNFRDSRGAKIEHFLSVITFKKRYYERTYFKLADK